MRGMSIPLVFGVPTSIDEITLRLLKLSPSKSSALRSHHGARLPGTRRVFLLQLRLHLELAVLGLRIAVLRVVGRIELRK